MCAWVGSGNPDAVLYVNYINTINDLIGPSAYSAETSERMVKSIDPKLDSFGLCAYSLETSGYYFIQRGICSTLGLR